MTDTLINLITYPDKLFNDNKSIILVNPSDMLKEHFNLLAKDLKSPINVYLYENNETEIEWLLDVCQNVDNIILDIDNTKIQQWVIGYILNFSKTFYLTNQVGMPYNIINSNRIYEFKQFMEGVNYFEVQ
tara:strand:- start:1299 stop:1688 length:390 start_codon:yes stop_codon:yes gene_type:complete